MRIIHIAAASGIALACALAGPMAVAEQQTGGDTWQLQQGQQAGGAWQAQQGQQGGAMGSGAAMDQAGALGQQGQTTSKRVGDITGTRVVNRSGEKVGRIDEIVRRSQEGADQAGIGQPDEHYAVISAGGFLGIGTTHVVMPLSELSIHEDQVVLPQTAATEDQLRQRESYDEALYEEVDEDMQVRIERSEFAAFEGDRQPGLDTRQQDRGGMQDQGTTGQDMRYRDTDPGIGTGTGTGTGRDTGAGTGMND
jgi:hypothetical protein